MAEITMPRLKASPVARRLAARRGVALDGLTGSGPGGRVVKADIERAAQHDAVVEAPAAVAAGARGEVTVEELTSARSTVAARMTAAKATVPDFTLTTEVEMDAALELRSHLSELGLDPLPSINDLVVKACAAGAARAPARQRQLRRRHDRDPRAGQHRRSRSRRRMRCWCRWSPMRTPRRSRRSPRKRVRSRSSRGPAALTPDQVSGATFTISNLGMYGITQFTAILNPPQAAILAVGSVREQALSSTAVLSSRRRMSLTATCDHRILYGADAATFVQSIKTTLEQPLRLLV